MKKLTKWALMALTICIMTSCQSYSDGRMLKKFISRFNHKEYACASAYIFPADQMEFAFFVKNVMPLAPDAMIELKDYKSEGSKSNRKIEATLRWVNATPALSNYLNEIGLPISENGTQNISINIRTTNDGETLSLPWPNPMMSNRKLVQASIHKKDDGQPIEGIQIHKSPSDKSKILGYLEKTVMIDKEPNNGWYEIFTVESSGHVETSYFKEDSAIFLDSSAFFHLGVLDSLGLAVAFIVIIVVIGIVYLLCGSMASIFHNIQWGGPIFAIGLILGCIYVMYQMLEKILFELFIINLPY